MTKQCATEESLRTCKELMAESRPIVSNSVLEEHRADGLGTFTAYEDGRVRVCFDDRTLLNMDASRSNCSIILSTGKQISVRVDMPIGVEFYVESALDFSEWAYKTPAERGNTLQMRLEIQRTAERCARAAAICDWTLSKKLPVSATKFSDPEVTVSKSTEANRGKEHVRMGTEYYGFQGGNKSIDFSPSHSLKDPSDNCSPNSYSDLESAVQNLLKKTSTVLEKMTG